MSRAESWNAVSHGGKIFFAPFPHFLPILGTFILGKSDAMFLFLVVMSSQRKDHEYNDLHTDSKKISHGQDHRRGINLCIEIII
jgi:hypothetical protein